MLYFKLDAEVEIFFYERVCECDEDKKRGEPEATRGRKILRRRYSRALTLVTHFLRIRLVAGVIVARSSVAGCRRLKSTTVTGVVFRVKKQFTRVQNHRAHARGTIRYEGYLFDYGDGCTV